MGIVECDLPIRHVPTDGQQAPLKPKTVHKWLSIEWGNPKQELTATIPLATGIPQNEAIHLTPSWISEDDGEVSIRIPERARCTLANDRPCQNCREQHDGYFGSRYRSRNLPVYDDRVAEVLRAYDPPGEQLITRSIYKSLRSLKAKADIERGLTCPALRNTFGVALAAKGCDREVIHRWIGNRPSTDYSRMTTAKDYERISATSPWDELEALGTGEFRPA